MSDKYHLIAPDYPGVGFSEFPVPDDFDYTFGNLSVLLNKFTEAINLHRFFIFLHDYGAPIGLQLCLNHPEKITGIIVQSGNAHREGMGPENVSGLPGVFPQTPATCSGYVGEI